MHRAPLIALLLGYRETYPEEDVCVDRFLAFIQAQPDCFERRLPIGHVTGSSWIVSKDEQKVLLTHHRKLNRWFQLGGHAEGNSDILSVALREAYEESGLRGILPVKREIFDLDIHLIPKRGEERAHHHYDVRFALKVEGDEAFQVSDESHALAWVEIDHLRTKTQEISMLRMQKKWRFPSRGADATSSR